MGASVGNGSSHANTVTGIPHPVGPKWGAPRIWKPLQVIW